MTRPRPPRPYRRLSPEDWALLRRAWRDGEAAGRLAARFGVSPHALHCRARVERWARGRMVRLDPRLLPPPGRTLH